MTFSEIDSRLEKRLKTLSQVKERNPQAAVLGRARFMEQAARAKGQLGVTEGVSQKPRARHIGWNILTSRKGKLNMSILSTILVIVSLLLGGTGVTVAAAQNSGPDDALYSIKLAGEDMRFALATQGQTRLNLALKFADERAEEIAEAVKAGEAAPGPVITRWQQHLQTALQLAAGMDEEKQPQALLQIQAQIRSQTQMMTQMAHGEDLEPAMQMIQTMLQHQAGLAEDGLVDPETFRQQMRAGQQSEETPVASGTPTEQMTGTPNAGYGPGEGGCSPNGSENGGNDPCLEGTPTPGSGYGPGPGEPNPTRTPQAQPGQGGDDNGSGSTNGVDNGNGSNGNNGGGGGDGGGGGN